MNFTDKEFMKLLLFRGKITLWNLLIKLSQKDLSNVVKSVFYVEVCYGEMS